MKSGAWNQLGPHSGISHKTIYEVGIYVAQLEGACLVHEKTDLILGSQLIVQHLENQNDIQGHPQLIKSSKSTWTMWNSCLERQKQVVYRFEHYVTEG